MSQRFTPTDGLQVRALEDPASSEELAHKAFHKGNVRLVKLLLDCDSGGSLFSDCEITPLIHGVSSSQMLGADFRALLRKLLDRGAHVRTVKLEDLLGLLTHSLRVAVNATDLALLDLLLSLPCRNLDAPPMSVEQLFRTCSCDVVKVHGCLALHPLLPALPSPWPPPPQTAQDGSSGRGKGISLNAPSVLAAIRLAEIGPSLDVEAGDAGSGGTALHVVSGPCQALVCWGCPPLTWMCVIVLRR